MKERWSFCYDLLAQAVRCAQEGMLSGTEDAQMSSR
jgi:hypothetical protein